MFIDNRITFTTLNTDNYCLDQDVVVCAIHLKPVYDKLCILAISRSSLGNFSTLLNNFDLILHKFFNLKFNVIICGDININYFVEIYKKNNLTISYTLLISVTVAIFLIEWEQILFKILQCFYRNFYFNIFDTTRLINGYSDHNSQLLTIQCV
jgi:hypothetical protein